MLETAPAIETARLRLRAHTIDDFAACFALWTDPIVVRHISGKPSTPEEVWGRLHRYAGHWKLLGFGYWVLEEKDGGAFAGEVGFADFKREIVPPMNGAPEAGWVLAPHAHGKGYATEAIQAALAWIEREYRAPRTMCIISPDNAPSIRVAEKVGYRQIAQTTYKEWPTLMFER